MWNRLSAADKPVVLYGTGNAAEKIISELNKRNIAIAGIFASDGFVRSRNFAGFPVLSYEAAKAKFGAMIVLLCFGSHLPDVIENIKRIAKEQELYAPDLPIAGEGLFSCSDSDVTELKQLLADEKSCEVLDSVVSYKRSGKIDHLFACETAEDENWGILRLNEYESYLDLGAYNGDTVRQFLRLSGGKYESITAVEPEARNFRKLCENCDGLNRITFVNKAIGKEKGIVYFSKALGRGGSFTQAEKLLDSERSSKIYEVEKDSVDGILQGKPVSFIKMDLEGAEQDAIIGASETIKKYMPKLLISAYHRNDDLFVIPKLILALNSEYKIYLRKSPCLPAWEINYYIV